MNRREVMVGSLVAGMLAVLPQVRSICVKPRVLIDYADSSEDEFGFIYRRILFANGICSHMVSKVELLSDGNLQVTLWCNSEDNPNRTKEAIVEDWKIECYNAYGQNTRSLTIKDFT